MAIGSGDLREQIVVQRATTVPNEFNEPVETWADYYTFRARREDAGSGEKDAAGQVGAFLMARFTLRRSSKSDGILQTDRIIHDGGTWSIKEKMRLAEDPLKFILIKAVRDAD